MSNDRHKYRVAVKQGLEWQIYDVLNILFKSDGTIWVQTIRESESATFTAWWLVDGKNVILEQCTGLTDKNGKLIYEGDVVRYYRSTAMCLGGKRIAQVLWYARDAEFGILTTLGDGYNMWEALRFGIEIIGTIHDDQFREVTKLMEGDKCD